LFLIYCLFVENHAVCEYIGKKITTDSGGGLFIEFTNFLAYNLAFVNLLSFKQIVMILGRYGKARGFFLKACI
jgi:hypothetical protein